MIGKQDHAVLLVVTWLQDNSHGTAEQLKNAKTNVFEDNGVLFVTVSFKAEGDYAFFDLSVDQKNVVTLIRAY